MHKDEEEAKKRAALLRASECLWGEVTERCKRVDQCVEWDSITWRYGVTEADKAMKTKGRCLCEERRNFLEEMSRSGT
jgi:hypothetical protein